MIDNKTFANMCQAVAKLQGGVQGTKEQVPDSLKVIYEGTEFYPQRYILCFESLTGRPIHQGQLHDLKANSCVVVSLEHVERKMKADDK